MGWRRQLVGWHRDLGYLACGMTVAYAVSGIAVNHREHWDYNRATHAETRSLGPPAALLDGLEPSRRDELRHDPAKLRDAEVDGLARAILLRLERPYPPRNAFWRGPDALHLYLGDGDADVVVYHPSSGTAEVVSRRDRWVLRDLNFLHLNEGRGLWTYVADAFALVLVALALSGIFIVRGRRGLRGRGGWLLVAGLAVPLLALLAQRYW
jgi:hypothetical protein